MNKWPVPPRDEIINLLLFVGVIEKVQDRIVKPFRVGRKICPGENWGGAEGESDLQIINQDVTK